jgi:hypothetical protein
MLTYLFYFVPFCALASYSLFNAPAKQWFLDWLIIYAGATANVKYQSNTAYCRQGEK